MGIKGVNPFLKEKVPYAFIEKYDLALLKGYRIAIDAANWTFMILSGEHRNTVVRTKNIIDDELDREMTMQKFYKRFIDFNLMLLEADITPVWCWDGKAHDEKGPEREKRRAERKERQDKVEKLKAEIEQVPSWLRNVNNLGMVPDEHKALACEYQEKVKEVQKIMATQVSVSYEEIETIKQLATGLGIPSLVSDNEGEMLCAQLALQGKVMAVWSADTDNYAMGTPFLITGFNGFGPGRTPLVKAVVIPYMLAGLEMTQQELRDFCIMCGTDYNSNICKIGPKKSFDLLKKHKTIEAIRDEAKLDISCLKHTICRDYLTPKPIDLNTVDLHLNGNKFMSVGRDILNQYGLDDCYDELHKIMKHKVSSVVIL